MTAFYFRRYTVSLISIFHLITMTLFSISSTAWAQQLDSEPPVIEMEIVTEGVRGETQVFSATVVDNIEVSSVIFHHRYDGDGDYTTTEMTLIPNTSVYTASVDPGPANSNAIEYYIEARDGGDNRTLQGFSFDPLDRALVSADAVASATGSAPQTGLSTNRKIVYGVLGLLVVGALAASSSGGSSSSASGGPGPLVPTQIIVEPFQ